MVVAGAGAAVAGEAGNGIRRAAKGSGPHLPQAARCTVGWAGTGSVEASGQHAGRKGNKSCSGQLK